MEFAMERRQVAFVSVGEEHIRGLNQSDKTLVGLPCLVKRRKVASTLFNRGAIQSDLGFNDDMKASWEVNLDIRYAMVP